MSSPLEEHRATPERQPLSRHPAAGAEAQPELMLWRTIQFVRRHARLVLGVALLAALVAALFFQFLAAAEYEAVAVLIVAPAKFTSALKAETLSVRGHQRLLESDAVIAATFSRLVEKGVLDEADSLQVGRELSSRIPVSVPGPRGQPMSDSPLIEIVARAGSPEAAAEMANSWANAFIEHSRRLVAESTAPTIGLAETEYRRRRGEIDELTKARTDLANEYQARIDEVELKWLRRIADAAKRRDAELAATKKKTEQVLAAYQNESRRIIEEFVDEQGLAGVGGADGADQLRRLATLRVQLAQTPPVLLLEKAMSDDALWQAAALREFEVADIEKLAERTNLLTQEVNPVATELTLEVSRIEAGLVDAAALGVAARLESLQRERSAGLASLTADRVLEFDRVQYARRIELAELLGQKRLEVESLQRELENKHEEVEQDLESKRTTFALVAENYEQALLANADEELEDIQLSWPAVPPQAAKPKRVIEKALLAALIGAVAGLILALYLEARALGNQRARVA